MAWPLISIGTVLGSEAAEYEVVDVLGSGSFGIVYKVRHLEVNNVLAFKTPRENLEGDEEYLPHFIKEARAWVRLQAHQNLVKGYDFHRFPRQGNRPFISMEFVRGTSLKKLLGKQGGYLAPCQVFDYAVGICQGMKYARDDEDSERALVHRDIKPENVLVRSQDNTPKVTDFGLARLEGTGTLGVIAGTWPYMAPDVVRYSGHFGEPMRHVDRRADIYSLGVTLYQALSGQFPIDLHGLSWHEKANEILQRMPADIRDRLPADSRRVPDGFLGLVMDCLHKNLSEPRPQTWDAMLEKLVLVAGGIREASKYDVCTTCGFMPRNVLTCQECPLCGSPSIENSDRASSRSSRMVTETLSVRRVPSAVPVFLAVPGGKSVVGANITVLLDMRDQAEKDEVDLNLLKEPEAYVVELPGFEIGRTPVTEEEFAHFEKETGYHADRRAPKGISGAGKLPVTGVTFVDAEAFCDWLGGRLPTAEEWEKAARGTDGRAYPWGNTFDASMCACKESHVDGPAPVDAHSAARSPFGLLECVGNVGELVDAGKRGRKFVLGGCFEDRCRYYGLLWTRKWQAVPDLSDPTVGFRAARDTEPPSAFEASFVRIEGEAILGCDESLIPELECRIPLDDSVLGSFRRNRERVVRLDPFEIGIYPVTNEEYWCFVNETHHRAPDHWCDEPFPWTSRPYLSRHAYHPVVHVRHSDAIAYCRWLSERDPQYTYCLPTREQWEAAARGGKSRIYPWGDPFDATKCNGGESHRSGTVDVRKYPDGDSPYGCRQMTGNVFEWLEDEQGDTRFMRGGAFNAACEVFGMTFFETETDDVGRAGSTGFRLVRTRP